MSRQHPSAGLVEIDLSSHISYMADEPRKIFNLMDIETEPTDEQLAELMHYVEEAVRAKKRAAGLKVREGNGSVNESASRPYGT